MSTLFGIFNRNGQDVSAETLTALQSAAQYWTSDACGSWLSGPVGLGHLMLWNTPESQADSQPRIDEADTGLLAISADVRLDNREELFAGLAAQPTLAGRQLDSITDTEFLLAAYREWGADSPAKLLGDFAFAIWDGSDQSLFCVRDHLGIKPFYFHLDEDIFVFSNDIRCLAGQAGVSTELDEQALASYLMDSELLDAEMTFFAAVRKLPPATSLKITHRDTVRQTYWRAQDSVPVRFDTLQDYADRLSALLEDAVRVRLRTAYPVASHLSGGLDSAVISALAARSLKQQGKTLYCYNWVHGPQQGDDAAHFEWANSLEVARRENVPHEFIELGADKVLQQLNTMDLATHSTSDPWYEVPLRQAARERDVRVILSGWGGDELISHGGRRAFTDAAVQGKFATLLREVYREARQQPRGIRAIPGLAWREALAPLLRHLSDAVTGRASDPQSGRADWLLKCARPEFVAIVQRQAARSYHGRALRVRDEQLGLLRQGHLPNRTESWANAGRADGIEYRYPLLDKRIVEFALGLPPECYRRQGSQRFLFRQAVSGLIPEHIRWNNYKREPQRVGRLLELLEAALQAWYAQARSDTAQMENYRCNAFMDVAELERNIELLKDSTDLPMRARANTVSLILKSILVLNAGRRTTLNPLESPQPERTTSACRVIHYLDSQ